MQFQDQRLIIHRPFFLPFFPFFPFFPFDFNFFRVEYDRQWAWITTAALVRSRSLLSSSAFRSALMRRSSIIRLYSSSRIPNRSSRSSSCVFSTYVGVQYLYIQAKGCIILYTVLNKIYLDGPLKDWRCAWIICNFGSFARFSITVIWGGSKIKIKYGPKFTNGQGG